MQDDAEQQGEGPDGIERVQPFGGGGGDMSGHGFLDSRETTPRLSARARHAVLAGSRIRPAEFFNPLAEFCARQDFPPPAAARLAPAAGIRSGSSPSPP